MCYHGTMNGYLPTNCPTENPAKRPLRIAGVSVTDFRQQSTAE
jgi:hypothetical protein